MSRVRRAAAGAATSYVQFALQILLQFLLAPLVLRYAGQETLGAYAIVGQVTGYLGLLDLGFSATFQRYLSHATGTEAQAERFRAVLVTGKSCLLGLNVFISIACFILAGVISHLLKLSPAVAVDAQRGLLVVGLWTLVRAPLIVAGAALVAKQDLAYRNLVSAGSNAIRITLSLALVRLGYGLLGLMVAGVIADLCDAVACQIRFHALYGRVGRGWGILDRPLFRDMLTFGRHTLMINLAVRLAFSSDQLVIGALFGGTASSVYYAMQTPAVLGWQAIMRLADATSPAITQLHAQSVHERLRDTFIRIHKYTLIVSLLFMVGFIGLNRAFISAWVGPQQYGGHWLNSWLAVFAVMISSSHVSSLFVMARGQIGTAARLALFEGVLNVVLSVILGWIYGLAGVMAATVICHVIGFSYVQWASQRALHLTSTKFLRYSVLPAMWPALLSTVAMWMGHRWLALEGLPRVIGFAVVLTILHFAISAAFSTDARDRAIITDLLDRVFRRRRNTPAES